MAPIRYRPLHLLCLLLVLAAPSLPRSSAAKARHYRWEVGYGFRSPADRVETTTITINGQLPGPTIHAKAGDTIVVELKNALHAEGVLIHWHGIRQLWTPWADSTASISQRVIDPVETFVYRFVVHKAGTYVYQGMQGAAGLYGWLIVDVADGEEEPFHYDGEFNLLLMSDVYYHKDITTQALGLSSNPIRWIREPQGLLINGRGQVVAPGNQKCDITTPQRQPVVLPVRANETYRLRIASTASLAPLNLAIENHKMVVVEAGGNYVQPLVVDDMDIYSGESYSVLIRADDQKPTSNFCISVGVRGRRRASTLPALAVLNYRPVSGSELPTSPHPVTPAGSYIILNTQNNMNERGEVKLKQLEDAVTVNLKAASVDVVCFSLLGLLLWFAGAILTTNNATKKRLIACAVVLVSLAVINQISRRDAAMVAPYYAPALLLCCFASVMLNFFYVLRREENAREILVDFVP